MSPSPPPTLLLWAYTQVGKTALLATVFYGANGKLLPRVDRKRSARALTDTLFEHWHRLQTGRPVVATANEETALDLITAMGAPFRITDIKGLQTLAMQDAAMARLEQAGGVLFLLELDRGRLGQQLTAIQAAIQHIGDRPRGIVFTKCERSLHASDPAWFARPGWWRQKTPRELEGVLEGMGDAVWPTSAYGFDAETGFPACIPGEFGDLLPWRPSPKNVDLPFEWMLDEMDVR